MNKIVVLLMFLFALCGCAQIKRTARIEELNSKIVTTQCRTPITAQPFVSFQIPMLVMRHKKCAGFDDLFLLGYWMGRSEYTDTLSKLLMLEYLRQLNLASIVEGAQYGYIFLKYEKGTENTPGFVFYEFVRVK